MWCSSTKEVDPSKADETKLAIRESVKRIDALAASTIPFVAMTREFITEIVYCLSAVAGCFWLFENDGFRPAYFFNKEVGEKGPPGFEGFRKSALGRSRVECVTLLFPPVNERDHYIYPLNTSRYLMLYSPVPWRSQAHPFSVVEVIQRPSQSAAARSGYKRFLEEMVAKIGFSYDVN